MVWPEIEQVSRNHRYELILSGDKLTKRLEESSNEIDSTIWTLSQLNFLEISQCPLIEHLPEDISKLNHLSTLTLTSNHLISLPTQINLLINLKHLNLSNNHLKTISNDLFTNLNHLETINLSNNQLEFFPSLTENNQKLAIINLSHNQLKSIPDFPLLENLSHLDLSSNQFQTIPQSILNLHSLKVFLIDSNQLKEIYPDICQLQKLKEIRFKSNPLKDNRLKKLMEQDKFKAVLEYLTKQFHEQQKSLSPNKSTQSKQLTNNNQQQQQQQQKINHKIEISHFDQNQPLKGRQITILPGVADVRPHILCCLITNIDLLTEGNLKKFLNLQNELHDEICQKRTLATIGTHDLNLIKGNLIYDARQPETIQLIPLGKGPKAVSAKDFYDQLWKDAEHERKLKKRNQLSGLNKYLTLIENDKDFVFLCDEDRHVISLPPLTNSDTTKLSPTSESIFVEITSNHSMDICRRIMENLFKEIFSLNLAKKSRNENEDCLLILQQTRIVDEKGQLKTTYPSRTDLNSNEFYSIERFSFDK